MLAAPMATGAIPKALLSTTHTRLPPTLVRTIYRSVWLLTVTGGPPMRPPPPGQGAGAGAAAPLVGVGVAVRPPGGAGASAGGNGRATNTDYSATAERGPDRAALAT
jgi:hypothetical protein